MPKTINKANGVRNEKIIFIRLSLYYNAPRAVEQQLNPITNCGLICEYGNIHFKSIIGNKNESCYTPQIIQ